MGQQLRLEDMTTSLKSANGWQLLAVVFGNWVCLHAIIETDVIFGGAFRDVVVSLPKVLPAGIGLAFVSLLNAQISSETKARIIFLRRQDSLPGSQAFTRYMNTDPRVDTTYLKEKYGPLPTDPRTQNAVWYKLYKSVEEHPSVTQVHRKYLFTRDYACLSLMMVVLLGAVGFFQSPSSKMAVGYFVLLIIQFLLASRAAKIHGRQFVTNVLALKSAGL